MEQGKDNPGFIIRTRKGGKVVQAQGRMPLLPGDRSVELVVGGKKLPFREKLEANQIAFGEPPTPEEAEKREQYERIKARKSKQGGTKR